MKPLRWFARPAALGTLCVAAALFHSDASAAPSSNVREAFGESPTLPGADLGGPAGTVDLVDVDETNGAPSATFPFELIRARGDAQPGLALHYVPNVDGEAGRGWTLSLPSIERKPLTGLPNYAADPTPTAWPSPEQTDRFQFGGMDLVPLCTVSSGQCPAVPSESFAPQLEGWRYFRPLVDSAMQRFFWSPDLLTWRIEDPTGAVSELGVPRNDLGYDAATDSESGQPPYRWNLVRQWDSRGELANPIVYRWRKFLVAQDSGSLLSRGYLTDIFDTPPGNREATVNFADWAHHTRLDWEAQPFTVLSGTNPMFRWHDHRLVLVSITSKDFTAQAPRNEVRMYGLQYADAPSGATGRLNSSYLAKITPHAMATKGTVGDRAALSSGTSWRGELR